MKKIFAAILVAVAFSSAAFASEAESDFDPWGKIELSMGMFMSAASSDVRIGSGFGLDIDVEDLLGMDATNFVFRVDASWRFTESRRHRLDLMWFSMHRMGKRDVLQDFEWEDRNGDTIYVNAGTRVVSLFNLDIYKVSYNYSIFQDDRFDIAAKVGLFIMPIEFGLTTSGAVEEELNEALTAPPPRVRAAFRFRDHAQLVSQDRNRILLSENQSVQWRSLRYARDHRILSLETSGNRAGIREV